MPGPRKRKQPQPELEHDSSEDDSHGSEREESDDDEQQAQAPPQSRAKPKKRAKLTQAAENVTLLDICKNHTSATAAAAKEWVSRYKINQTAAIAELLTLLVQAAGSTYEVTEEEVEEGEVDKLVSTIKREINKDGYVDLFKGKGSKQFKGAFLRLWDKIVQHCSEQEVLLDDALLERICHLLIGLSSSEMRCFRFVGTLTACHLATSLISVMLTLSEERDTALRQDAAEARKKGGKERAKAFKQTADRCHIQIGELQIHVNSIFQGITTNRFRDTCEEIRSVVIDGVGNWTHLYPAVFLNHLYLKYLGWALSDKEPVVREAAVDALVGLYSEDDNRRAMPDFTERFKDRFVELPNDVDDNVAIRGVKLLTLLVKVEELPHSQAASVCQLLLEESAPLRHAAAELVAELLADSGKQYMLQLQAGQKGRRKSLDSYSEEDLQLAGVLHIIHNLKPDTGMQKKHHLSQPIMICVTPAMFSLHKRTDQPLCKSNGSKQAPASASLVHNIVDALFDSVGVLQNWKALTQALLDDKACERRGEAATTDVALILEAAVQRACSSDLGLSSSGHRKQAAKNKAFAAIQNQRHELTMVMSKVLLKLLRKYQGDPIKAGALASILRHLKLEIFSLKHDEQGLEDILKTVASLLGKHAVPQTISHCLRALAHCSDPGSDAPSEPGRGIFQEAVANLVAKLVVSATDLLSLSDDDLATEAYAAPEDESEEAFACRAALLRILHLMHVSPAAVGNPELTKGLAALLQAAVEGRTLPPELLALAAQCQTLALMWQLQQLQEDPGSTFDSWPQSVKDFMDQLEVLLGEESAQVKATAILALTDLYLVFQPEKLKNLGAKLAGARVKAAPSQVDRLWTSAEELLCKEVAAEAAEVEDDGDPDAQEQAQTSKLKTDVVAALGRLVILEVEPFAVQLPGKLLSFLGAEDASVAAIVKDVAQHLKKAHNASMPEVYLKALEAAFERDARDKELHSELGRRVAACYAGFVPDASSCVAKIMAGGITYAFQGQVPQQVPFLAALQPLAGRASAKDAEQLISVLEKAVEGLKLDSNLAEWEPYNDLLKLLKDRHSKLPRSALKQAGQAGKRNSDMQARKISFKEAGKRRKPPNRPSAAAAAGFREIDRHSAQAELDDSSDQHANGQGAAMPQSDDDDEVEDSDAEKVPNEVSPHKLAPRFHSKTRRGSSVHAPPEGMEGVEEPDTISAGGLTVGSGQPAELQVVDEDDQDVIANTSDDEDDDEVDDKDDVMKEDEPESAGIIDTVPNTAEALPSGLFIVGTETGGTSLSQRPNASYNDAPSEGNELMEDGEDEEEEEESLPARVRPRRA